MSYVAQFIEWLSERPTWEELGDLVYRLFFFLGWWTLVMVICILGTLYLLGTEMPSQSSSNEEFHAMLVAMPVWHRVATLFQYVGLEEFRFRFVPIAIVLLMVKLGWVGMRTLAVVVILASAAFGLIHVFNYDDVNMVAVVASLLLQGVAGIVLSVLFLKYCGLRLRYVIGALIVSTLFHGSWDVALMFSVLFLQ